MSEIGSLYTVYAAEVYRTAMRTLGMIADLPAKWENNIPEQNGSDEKPGRERIYDEAGGLAPAVDAL